MKIKNETHWRTDQMKPIITRVLKDELNDDRRKRSHVRIVYGRGGRYARENGMCGGYAWYNSNNIVIKVPRDLIDAADFAHTVAHEAAHCRGIRHGQMTNNPDYMRVGNWRERYAWAAAMPIELRAAAKPQPKADVQIVRFNRTVDAIKRWETKLKRAANALKKLRGRKRYYERALAAKGVETND